MNDSRKNSAEWTYEDVPISNFKVLTEPNLLTGEIRQITNIAGKVQEQFFQTREDQIRNALIDLGWKPPEHAQVPSKLPQGVRKEYGKDIPTIMFMGQRIVDLNRNDLLVTISFLGRSLKQQMVRHQKGVDKDTHVD